MSYVVRLVDDDSVVLKAMSSVLESEGLTVSTFLSAEEFLISDAYSVPGCLIVDLKMPGMNGLELQAVLKQRDFKHPIIFLTAHGEVESAVLAMKRGAMDFIQKPASPLNLIEVVKHALKLDASNLLVTHEKRLELIKKLSIREKEVIKKVLQGLTNKEVGEALKVSEKTVENHRNSAYRKLNVSSFKELKKNYQFLEI